MSADSLTIDDIQETFNEQIAQYGGTVADTFVDGARLFVRSVLPDEIEVAPRDAVQGGVALRATHTELSVHPYIFRLVCKNGAIRAHATQTLYLDRPFDRPAYEVTAELRQAVEACCQREAFVAGAQEMRSAAHDKIDTLLALTSIISTFSGHVGRAIMGSFIDSLFGAERTRYDVMNAVTAVARDTKDPETRWRLEELGGGVPVMKLPSHRPPEGELAEVRESLELVG